MQFRKWIGTGCWEFLLGGLLFFGSLSGQETQGPLVGSKVPEFTLPLADSEQTLSPSEFFGKKILIIHFWKGA